MACEQQAEEWRGQAELTRMRQRCSGQPRLDAGAEGAAHSWRSPRPSQGLHRADTVQEKKERLQQICLRRLTEERKHELGQRKSLNRRRRQWRAAEAEGWHGLICGSPGGDRRTHGSPESQPPSYRRLQNQADHICRLNSLN